MAEQKQDCASLRIKYFSFGGRGVALRWAAAVGGLTFEDEFLTFEQQGKEKAAGQRRWAGLPELTVLDKDGKAVQVIAQSNTALRYIGKLAKLYPTDALQAALVDEVLDSVEDVAGAILPKVFGVDDDTKKKNGAELCKEGSVLRYWLGKFLARLAENEKRGNKNGLFVGDALTIADLKAAGGVQLIAAMVPGADREKGILSEAQYKPLLKVVDAVTANEKVKAFNAQFDKNAAAFTAKPEQAIFKYAGK